MEKRKHRGNKRMCQRQKTISKYVKALRNVWGCMDEERENEMIRSVAVALN